MPKLMEFGKFVLKVALAMFIVNLVIGLSGAFAANVFWEPKKTLYSLINPE